MSNNLLLCFNCGSVYDEKLVFLDIPLIPLLCPSCLEHVTISA